MKLVNRIPAETYWLERTFGKKVPQCRACGSPNVHHHEAHALYRCDDCGRKETPERVLMIPQDKRAR